MFKKLISTLSFVNSKFFLVRKSLQKSLKKFLAFPNLAILATVLILQITDFEVQILQINFPKKHQNFVQELILKNQKLLKNSQNEKTEKLKMTNPKTEIQKADEIQKAENMKFLTNLSLLELSRQDSVGFVNLINKNGKLFWQSSENQNLGNAENKILKKESLEKESLDEQKKTGEFTELPLGFWVENKTEKEGITLNKNFKTITQNLAGESIDAETVEEKREKYQIWKNQTLQPFWQEVDKVNPSFLFLSAVNFANVSGEYDSEFVQEFTKRGFSLVFVPMGADIFGFFGNVIAYQNLTAEIQIIAKIPPEGVALNPGAAEAEVANLVNQNKPLLYTNPVLRIQQKDENGKIQVYFLGTNYTSYFTSVEQRLEYIHQIIELKNQNPNAKFLLSGDFNTSGSNHHEFINQISQAQQFTQNFGQSQKEIQTYQKLFAQNNLKYIDSPLAFSSNEPAKKTILNLLYLQLDGFVTNLGTLAEYKQLNNFDHGITILEINPTTEKLVQLEKEAGLRKNAAVWISLIFGRF